MIDIQSAACDTVRVVIIRLMRNISHLLPTHTSTPQKAREFHLKARSIMKRMKKEEILMHNTRA